MWRGYSNSRKSVLSLKKNLFDGGLGNIFITFFIKLANNKIENDIIIS